GRRYTDGGRHEFPQRRAQGRRAGVDHRRLGRRRGDGSGHIKHRHGYSFIPLQWSCRSLNAAVMAAPFPLLMASARADPIASSPAPSSSSGSIGAPPPLYLDRPFGGGRESTAAPPRLFAEPAITRHSP